MSTVPVLSLSRRECKARIKTSSGRRAWNYCGVERLLERLPLIAWATDAELRLIWIDGGATRILGVDQQGAVGATVSQIFGFAGPGVVEYHRQALSGQTQTFEIAWHDRWYDLRIDPLRDERGAIVGSMGVARDVTEEKRAEHAIVWHASFDAVTGTLNRRRVCERLESLLWQSKLSGRGLAILYIDIDGFGAISDSVGSPAGDGVLRDIAERLRAVCPDDMLVARAAGDEFVIVIPDASNEATESICRNVQLAFAQPFAAAGRSLHVSVSIGAALFPRDGESVERLLRNAASAARYACEMGGNQVRIFSPAMTAGTVARLQMDAELRQALDQNELFLMYQPQICLADGSLSGVEALLRWRKDGDVVPAWSFIRSAEESALIVPIGEWVFDNAMCQLSEWRAGGLDPVRVAVNIGARQLADGSILTTIREALQKHEVGADRVDIEITETAAMQNLETTTHLIDELREMGAAITVDDFGTGYSSLSYLQRFAITGLKIDRSFTADLPQSPTAVAIVDAIISTARALGVRVVAEGVETEQQAAHLRAAGCGEAQGFLYARPLTAEAMTQYMATARQKRRRTARKRKRA